MCHVKLLALKIFYSKATQVVNELYAAMTKYLNRHRKFLLYDNFLKLDSCSIVHAKYTVADCVNQSLVFYRDMVHTYQKKNVIKNLPCLRLCFM